MTKQCSRCSLVKEIKLFYNSKYTKDLLTPYCKACWGIESRKYRIGTYGITEEQFYQLIDEQENRCAICQKEFSDSNKPAIDHDHSCCPSSINKKFKNGRTILPCGKCVRGLLCLSCNAGLGMFEDSISRLLQGVTYLKTHQPREFLSKDLSLESLEVAIYN